MIKTMVGTYAGGICYKEAEEMGGGESVVLSLGCSLNLFHLILSLLAT